MLVSDSPRTAPPSDDPRWHAVESRMRQLGNRRDALIEALHAAQQAFGHIDAAALRYIGRVLGIPPSTVYGVATFYSYFTLEPRGRRTCVVCTGTACYINGAGRLLTAIGAELGVEPGETTADGQLSLLTGRCFGSCSLAPAAIIDGEVRDRLGPDELVALLRAP